MGFPRQEYWSGLPFPPPGDLPDPGMEPISSASAGGFFYAKPPGKPSWFLDGCFSVSSLGKREETFPLGNLFCNNIKAQIPLMRTPSSGPNLFLKVPLPNAITVEIKYEFFFFFGVGIMGHLVHGKEPPFTWTAAKMFVVSSNYRLWRSWGACFLLPALVLSEGTIININFYL